MLLVVCMRRNVMQAWWYTAIQYLRVYTATANLNLSELYLIQLWLESTDLLSTTLVIQVYVSVAVAYFVMHAKYCSCWQIMWKLNAKPCNALTHERPIIIENCVAINNHIGGPRVISEVSRSQSSIFNLNL